MLPKEPFNVWLMDVDAFIASERAGEVKSHSIRVASSPDFHPEGLFSEEIFGQIGTGDRMVRFGYIRLNTKVFQPIVYKTILQLKQLYGGIMAGTEYAKFDEEEQDFMKCTKDDPDADTGYSFFVNNFHKIKFNNTPSLKRKIKLDILEKYKDRLYCNKAVVIPAGERDIRTDDGILSQEDINKLYLSLLSFADRLPPGTTNPIFDGVRMNIQKKLYEVYCYIENIMTNKKGFLQGAVGHRKIAMGTRNVIASAKLACSRIGDTRSLKNDETKCPLFQTTKAFQPILVYFLKTLAFNAIFAGGAKQVPLIHPTKYSLTYVELSPTELDKFRTPDGMNNLINRFKNAHIRHKPVAAKGDDGKYYYLYLIYDKDDKIMIFRNKQDLIDLYAGEEPIDEKYIRPMTWAELMYIAAYVGTIDKHVTITRYPVIQDESCYPSKVHLMSTSPSRRVTLVNISDPTHVREFPEFPVMDAQFNDSVVLHPCKLGGLGADYDGDTVSMNGIWADDTNAEIREYLNSPLSLVSAKKDLIDGGSTDDIKLTLFNMSRIPA